MANNETKNVPVEGFKDDYKVYQPNPMLMVYDTMENIWQARFLKAYQAKVRPSDPDSYWVKFSLEEFLDAVGVAKKPSVETLSEIAKSIRKTGFDFYEYRRKYGNEKLDPKLTKEINLFEYFAVEGSEDEGYYVEARPTRTMEELLRKIANLGYVDYEVKNVLGFSSKRTIRFYEFLKRSEGMDIKVKVDELKIYIGVPADKYQDVKTLTRDVVKKSIDEINRETDIEVKWETLSSRARGGKTIGYRFAIHAKPQQPKIVPPTSLESTAADDKYEQLNIDTQEPPENVNRMRDAYRQDCIDIVRGVVRKYLYAEDDLEQIVVGVEHSKWWEKSQPVFFADLELKKGAFQRYVEAQYVYTKARSTSQLPSGFLKYLIGAVRTNYAEVPVLEAEKKSTFDTREFYIAAVKRSLGEDFDMSLLDER